MGRGTLLFWLAVLASFTICLISAPLFPSAEDQEMWNLVCQGILGVVGEGWVVLEMLQEP